MRRPPTAMPALITPFDRNGEIDLDAHDHNVELLRDRGVRGFLLAGSTGEGPYLEPGERRRLVAAARRAAPRAFLVCGLAAETPRGALAQAREAVEGDADAVLALSPTTLIRGRDALVAGFFVDLARRSPLPILLYSVPRVTGYEVPLGVVADLSSHDEVIGIKDSGGHPVRARSIVEATPDGFLLYAGASAALALSIGGGGYGGITASANYAPELVLNVVHAARRSVRGAEADQSRLTALAQAVEAPGVPAVKAAAELRGLRAGYPRRPLRPVPARVRRSIAASLASAGLPGASRIG